jgi:casein kinase II subunit beta
VGLSDLPYNRAVKLYCIHCQDIYTPKTTRHATLDGAYFGTTFAHMFFMVYPHLVPRRSTERYVPRIFGFRIHDQSKLHRRQDEQREEQERRVAAITGPSNTTSSNAAPSTTTNQASQANVRISAVSSQPSKEAQ